MIAYQKTVTDKTIILGPREAFIRPFDFGDWTEMRIGMFVGAVTAAGDNTGISTPETLALTTYADRLTIGIKDNTDDMPGVAGTNFVGYGTDGTHEAADQRMGVYNNSTGTYAARLSALSSIGTAFTARALINASPSGIQYPNAAGVAGVSGYNGFWCIKLLITDRGLATQTISVDGSTTQTIAGTDYSATALRSLMNSASFFDGGTAFDWFDGGPAARAIPDCVWIRNPYFNNRIRISCLRAIRYA